MSIVELIPIEKGNCLILDETTVTTIGRTPNIGCLDKKISRNHAELYIKPDGTVWIKPIHHNPTFYRTKENQLITLTKDQEFQLNDNDEIGLLPNEYFYRISIKPKDEEEEEKREDSSTILKSPIHEEESSPIKDSSVNEYESSPVKESPVKENGSSSPVHEDELSSIENYNEKTTPSKHSNIEPEGGVILHTSRALPVWMSTRSVPESKNAKGRSKSKTVSTPTKTTPTPSPSKYRTYIGREKVSEITYDDDDDEKSNDVPSTTAATPTDQNNQTSSVIAKPVKRERCPYGKFCYRKNPAHRQEAIHPGDPDWDNKENDTDNTKPECPYGSDCYRKNPDHFNEYSHNKKRSPVNMSKQRTSKRKGSDEEEDDDDDGLPNEYDYNDSFIDDDNLAESTRIDRADSSQKDPDNDWKPHRKARHSDDDDESNSTDKSEINLLNEEAAEFVQGSSVHDQRPAKKKARVHMSDADDDD
ncbi:unnamed protein product [Adineta steineri]|uniref:Aprataxin and PNK-like factor n=1 Tax=Adineta steineri TaxID=433720 RepID=A0A815MA29_9BILA|nr:unnamed protein product [Adineta steineri]